MFLLLPNIELSTPLGFYRCLYRCGDNCHMYIAKDPTSTCPFYSGAMNSPATLVNPPNKVSTLLFDANEGGYIKGVVTYKIMNDLTVTLMLTISNITMLNKLNLQQVDALEEKVIDVDINESTNVFLTQKARKKGSK
ncbi:hypothetical protein Godav_024122 [Gossypium davidsonii]|uniref:Uncharacterized protein n=1 Tax=Gossypium davidsonii TaxID=34287 RepID=A0A7J8SUT4_GOSDV|nr:hypothetical protein [Gossypium davidsonii]